MGDSVINPHPLDNRFNDLNRQGFMKPRRKARKAKGLPVIVACAKCQNWHERDKHFPLKAEQ